MSDVLAVACGPPSFQKNEAEQTNASIAFRVTAFALGVIAIVVGALIVARTQGLAHLGTASGYSILSVGIVLGIAALSMKCIKKEQVDSEHALLRGAKKEGEAFLIDFSKINPSNIFEVFAEESHTTLYGDTSLSRGFSNDESSKFTQNFPHKYSIRTVHLEKNEHGYPSSSQYCFTMNDEGKVESYGKVFDTFDEYLNDRMKWMTYKDGVWLPFEHLNFHSASDTYEYKILRKKSSATA